jgi:hypothetical protein
MVPTLPYCAKEVSLVRVYYFYIQESAVGLIALLYKNLAVGASGSPGVPYAFLWKGLMQNCVKGIL